MSGVFCFLAKGVFGAGLVYREVFRSRWRRSRIPRGCRDGACLVGLLALSYPPHMATTLEELAEGAMSLPPESRARLADLLVESLEAGDLGAIDRMWIAEARRRRDEVRTGKVQTIPGDEALRRVRDAVRR